MPTAAQYTFEPATAELVPVYAKPGVPRTHNVTLAAGTYSRGTVLGELTATPGTFKPYAAANTDGSQTAKLILKWGCVVDAQGNVTLAGEFGQTQRGVEAYYGGGNVFKTTELVGLDAGAVTSLGASLVEGTLANGLLRF